MCIRLEKEIAMSLRKKKTMKKRREMLRSAAKVVSQKGYDRATMDDIASELLMTKGALYYYFDCKEELIYQCHELILSEALKVMEEIVLMDLSPVEKLEKAIITHIGFAINEKDILNLILKPEQTFEEDHLRLILEKRQQYDSIFDRIIMEGLNKGVFTSSEPKLVRMMILGAMNWIQTWYSPHGKQSPEVIAKIYAESLLKLLL